jgi:hypothetical protein
MKLKAGDGDRTRDVQLGNMDVVCLSKTSLFNTFIQVYPKEAPSLYIRVTGQAPSIRTELCAFSRETEQLASPILTNQVRARTEQMVSIHFSE